MDFEWTQAEFVNVGIRDGELQKDIRAASSQPIPAPTHLDTTDTKFLEVSKDKLTIKYIGKGSHAHDVGCIRANRPLPNHSMIAYYEVTIIDPGTKGSIYIGLAPKSFSLNRHPGLEDGSFGYSGEDGKKYNSESSRGEAYASPFSTGDIIGCGINFAKKEIFFTKNGKYLGPAFKKLTELLVDINGIGGINLYPTVGVHSPGEIVSFNFGNQSAFKYDGQQIVEEQQRLIMNEVNSIHVSVSDVNALIANYLQHYGYEETLKSFQSTSPQELVSPPADEMDTSGSNQKEIPGSSQGLSNRKRIRQAIMDGNIPTAISLIHSLYTTHLSNNQFHHAMLMLHCQSFIELIRQAKIEDAIKFARETLANYISSKAESRLNSKEEDYLQEVMGLIAYEDPSVSPLKHLMQIQHREVVADAVNHAVLSIDKNTDPSTLEMLLKQLVASLTLNFGKVSVSGLSLPFDTEHLS